MIDEVVACADCGPNPLAHAYAKLSTVVDTGLILSASLDTSNMEPQDVLPITDNTASFTQVKLHTGEAVTPLNGIADLDYERRKIVVDSWSSRVFRMFPPYLVHQIK